MDINPLTGQPTVPQMQSAAPAAAFNPGDFGDYSDWAKNEAAKGFTPEQLHQTLQSQGVNLNAQPAPTATEKPKKGNWFTNLLPTIGSLAVPALGALLAPVTGGTSLIAAAGLSGLGAAGGKLAENAFEGNSAGDDLVSSGVEGAVGGLVGGIGGKLLGKGASMLGATGEKLAAKEASTLAAREAIDTAATTYKDIAPALQKAYNAKDSLAHVAKMGYEVADPTNLVHVSNTSNDILNDVLNRALSKSGPVDMSNYQSVIREALAKEGGTLGSFDKVALARGRFTQAKTPAAQLLQQLEDLGAGVAKPGSDPMELRELTTKLGKLAADNKPMPTLATGALDPVQVSRYNTINTIRDQVKKALYDRAGVSDALKGEIGNLTANPEMKISQELADHLNDVITKSSNAQDLLGEISRNINIGKLGEEGKRVSQIVTSTGAKGRAAAEAGLVGEEAGTGSRVLDTASNFINPHAGGIVSTAVKGAVHAAKNPAILETLSRIGGMGSKLLPIAGGAAATLPGAGADPVPVAGGTGIGYGETNGTMRGNMEMNGGSPGYQDLINAMEAQAVLAPSMGGGASSFLAQIAPQLQKNQLAAAGIEGIPASFANAGGAQGPSGIMSHISAMIPGTAAHTYQKQREAAAAQLAQAMGISPQQAMGLLPEVMQNENTAGITSGILSNMSGALAR